MPNHLYTINLKISYSFLIFVHLIIKSNIMGLSSNILWHQTTADGLRGILKEKGFFYSYSLETISSTEIVVKAAFPMVSVCDFPLCEIGDYLKRYGGYSIGLTRDWGVKNGLSPVWYCEATSSVLKMQLSRFKEVSKSYIVNNNARDDFNRFIHLFSYIKNYEGVLPNRGYKIYRFYDEREFRIVPTIDLLRKKSIKPFYTSTDYQQYKDENKSSMIRSLKLPFEWEDIRFIIVDNNKNIDEMRSIIEKMSGKKDLRINYFTNDQIKEDVIGTNHNLVVSEASLSIKETLKNRNQLKPKSGKKIT